MNMNQFDKFQLTKYDYEKHCYVELVTTNACNQNCEYCHWNEARTDGGGVHVTLEEFDKVLPALLIKINHFEASRYR